LLASAHRSLHGAWAEAPTPGAADAGHLSLLLTEPLSASSPERTGGWGGGGGGGGPPQAANHAPLSKDWLQWPWAVPRRACRCVPCAQAVARASVQVAACSDTRMDLIWKGIRRARKSLAARRPQRWWLYAAAGRYNHSGAASSTRSWWALCSGQHAKFGI